jgi:DNA-binding transcriptional LysR family regulator
MERYEALLVALAPDQEVRDLGAGSAGTEAHRLANPHSRGVDGLEQCRSAGITRLFEQPGGRIVRQRVGLDQQTIDLRDRKDRQKPLTPAHGRHLGRRVSPCTGLVCAAPDYLARRGTPEHPKDLVYHECLRYPDWAKGQRKIFFGPEGEVQVDVKSRLTTNNAFAIRYAALTGAGIVLMRDELLAEDVAAGRLQVLLPDYKTQSRARHIVWLKNRKMTPKLRAFIDFVAEVYG